MKEFLTPDLIKTEVDCDTWQQAVQEVGGLLLKKELIKEDFIQTMIDVIHTYGPYMILLPGIAFFHGKPGELVKEPCLSLITLKHPVYFKEFENQEIVCAFGFGAVDGDSHMEALQDVVKLLQNEEFTSLIKNHGSKEEIIAALKKIGGNA